MKYYNRGFLNPEEGMAAYGCWVNFDDDPEYSKHTAVEAGFTIGDCTRKIELDFYTYNEDSYNDNIHKLNILISRLEEFKSVLVCTYQVMKENKENDGNTL